MTKIIRTGFTAFITGAFLASGLAAAPSASAEDVPPVEPTTYTVTGSTPPTETYGPGDIALCTEACIGGTERIPELTSDKAALIQESGEFAIEDVDAGAYRLAVVFGTLDKAGAFTLDSGYLKRLEDGTYGVADNFDGGTVFDVADPADGTTTVAYGTMVVNNETVVVTPPTTKPRKPFPTAKVTWEGGSVVGTKAGFLWKAKNVRRGTTIVTKVKGCNGKVVARKRLVRTGTFKYNLLVPLNRVGKRAGVRIIVSQANHRTRVLSYASPRLPGPGC